MRSLTLFTGWLVTACLVCAAAASAASLLVLEKRDMTLAVIDPTSFKVVAKMPSGPDPHEVVASDDGTTAYISNYGGTGSAIHTISVVDLVHRKALPAIDIAPLHSAHGLDFADGKLYFTSETNKVIGRYDPVTQKIDWMLGVGQERTHMILARDGGKKLFTSNVNSDSVSIIEPSTQPAMGPPPGMPPPGGNGMPPPGGPPPGPRTPVWQQANVTVGKGPEGFDVSPDGKELWAANSHDGSVTIVDVASKKVVQTLDANIESSNRLKFTPDGKYVLLGSLRRGDVAVIDAATHKEIKRMNFCHGVAGILMRPDNTVAYAACTPDNYVAVISLKTFTVVGKIEPGTEPDGMAWAVKP